MSRGKNLQEMEVGTKQSKTAVNANAKAGDPMPHLKDNLPDGQSGSWEDLGGPTPENYRSDDDSAKLDTPGKTLKQVKDIISKNARSADSMKSLNKEEVEEDSDVLEEENDEEEIIDENELVSESSKNSKKHEEDDDEEDDEEEDDENEEVKKEEFNIDEDMNALMNVSDQEDLSEEFKEKAKVIFESALRSKVSEIREFLEIEYEQRLLEEVEEIKAELQERVDSYLEYVSDEWIAENSLTIENGIKEELTESFMSGLKGLFEEHYVSIPEDKYDVLESMVEKLDDMETKLNEQIEKNIYLNKRLSESVADRIFDEVSEGLATTQKEKLASLSESVEFDSDQEYREKLETLKESYFPSKKSTPKATPETLSEGVDIAPEFHSDTMNAYLRTLSAIAKN